MLYVQRGEVEPNRSWILKDKDGDYWWFNDDQWLWCIRDQVGERGIPAGSWSDFKDDRSHWPMEFVGQFIGGRIHWGEWPIMRGEGISIAPPENRFPLPEVPALHDSGTRQQFEGGGVRDTAEGKPRFDLLWPKDVPYEAQFLTQMAQVLQQGAEKYAPRNWELFYTEEAKEHAQGSLGRHYANYMAGSTDEPHLILMACNLLMLATLEWKIANGWKPSEEA